MPHQEPKNDRPAWRHHEDYVASLYRSLGFSVTPNISVAGQQADLLCEKFLPGIGRIVLYVDCKHTGLLENKSVSKDVVDQFIYSFSNRNTHKGWTAGVMVSNRPFSQFAKTAAEEHPNIHLKTVDELHEEVLHVRSYLHEAVRRYDETSHFFDFIPPYGTQSDFSRPATGEPVILENLVRDWIHDDALQQLCLFGDFGAGKTTFLEFLHYSFAQKYLTNSSVRIPLLIPLRRFYDSVNHEELIRQFFFQECGVKIQYSLFQEFLYKGRFLLLFDGFDEMGARSDPIVRKTNYLKIAPLVAGLSKVVISCRPAFFISQEETRAVFAMAGQQGGFAQPIKPSPVSEQLYSLIGDDLTSIFSQARTALRETAYLDIKLFNKRQIKTYLKKHDEDIRFASQGQLNAGALFKRIEEIYDLEDLAQRPILLKLIVKTLPSFRRTDAGKYQIDIGGTSKELPDITPSALYEVYTQRELVREHSKGEVRALIDRKNKVRVIAAIALDMFRSDELAIDRSALWKSIHAILSPQEGERDHYVTDIATCSFLSRDVHDSIRFTHKSFMEYYAAVGIRLGMSSASATQNLLSGKFLNDEVALFLGDSIAVAADGAVALEQLTEVYQRLVTVPSPSEVCLQNLLNIFNYARKPVSPIKGIRVQMLVYRRLEIQEQAMQDVRLERLRTVKVKSTKWALTDSDIVHWEAQSTVLENFAAARSTIKAVRFWDSHIEQCSILKGNLHFETWRRSSIRDATCTDSLIVNGSGSVGPEWLPTSGQYENCVFVGMDFSSHGSCDSSFSNCIFVMCRGDERLISSLASGKSRGVFISMGSAKSKIWGPALVSCGYETALEARKKKLGKSPEWQDVLLKMFDPDLSRLPKSANDINAKLQEVEMTIQLSRSIGQSALLRGGSLVDFEECLIRDCDEERVTLYHFRSKVEFTHLLAKINIEGDAPIRITVK